MTDNHVPYRPGMTLMPGQSTSISVPIPSEVQDAMQGRQAFSFRPVAPPTRAPVQSKASALGLVAGLRVEDRGGSPSRCCNCHRMAIRDQIVWVPDSVRPGDSAEDITEICRQNAYNGRASGWCVPCAQTLGRPSVIGFFARLFGGK